MQVSSNLQPLASLFFSSHDYVESHLTKKTFFQVCLDWTFVLNRIISPYVGYSDLSWALDKIDER